MSGVSSSSKPYTPKRTYKRPYKKSINGCRECKTRKIKCDEARPVCGNCRKRYIDTSCCQYVSKTDHRRGSSEDSRSPPKLSASLSVIPAGLNHSNILELRLMHNYTRSTCGRGTMLDSVPLLSIWEIDIPQIAFSSEIVLNALLAISAWNLLSHRPNDREMALASRVYFDRAIEKHRSEVDSKKLDSHNAEPLLVAAVLLTHHHWLSAHGDTSREQYQIDLKTYHMCKGIYTLTQKAAPWLAKYDMQQHRVEAQTTDSLSHFDFMESASQDMIALMEAAACVVADKTDQYAYKQASEEIIKIYALLAHGSVPKNLIEQTIVSILHRVPERFVELVEKEDPIALALMARVQAVLKLIDDSGAWWIHGAGKWKVSETAVWGIKRLMPAEWLWTMDWPLKVVSKEINLQYA